MSVYGAMPIFYSTIIAFTSSVPVAEMTPDPLFSSLKMYPD